MTNIAIEFISVFGLSPVALTNLAADLGYQHITTTLEPFGDSLLGYPRFSLRKDAALRRELIAVMADRGISLSLGEGIGIMENVDVRDAHGPDLELMAELGIPRINVVSLEPDLQRTFDQLGHLTEMASQVGMETLIEFVPIFTVATLPEALAAVRHVGRKDCRIMLDTMHFFRSGAQIADLAEIDPEAIGYIQLCDAPFRPVIPDYMEEAVYQRAAPGDGELPLQQLLEAAPRDRVVGLEIPLRAEALAGIGHEARMRHCLEAARNILPAL